MIEEKLKILMLNHEFPPVGGGASPVTYELCKQLAHLGHHVDVVTMHYRGTPRFESVDGFNVYRTPAVRRKPDICHTHEMATYLPGAIFKTLKLARKNSYDIIHCHFIVPGAPLAWLVGKLTGTPFIVTCHGSDVPGYNPDRFKVIHRMIMPAWRFLTRRADLLVSPSRSLKSLIRTNCPGVEVDIVPNGFHPTRFLAGEKEKRILMCSRILPRKGFQYALEAMRSMQLDWKVDIVGDGHYLDELRKIAAQMDTPVKFWGWLDQKSEEFRYLYESGSIFIFPSEAENFPSVLLEAMAASMAIITSDAGGCPEVVGDAAIIVKPGDTVAIREAIEKLTASETLCSQYGAAALERVRQFDWKHIANRNVDCYRNVIERRKNKK